MKRSHPERGSALLIAVIVMMIMVGLTGGFLVLTLSSTKSTGSNVAEIQALENARAGANAAVAEIRNGYNADGSYKDTDGDGFADSDIDRDGLGVLNSKSFGGGDALYDVKVYYTDGGTEFEVGTVNKSIPATASTARVVAFAFKGFRASGTGVVPTATAASRSLFEYRRAVEVSLDARPRSNFNMGLFGKKSLDVTGSATSDSYNSNDGDYNAQPTQPSPLDGRTPIVRTNGDIGSNGPITIRGNSMIHGDATAGPGDSTTLIGDGEKVTGSKTPMEEEKVLIPDPVEYASDPDLPTTYYAPPTSGGGKGGKTSTSSTSSTTPTTLSSGTLTGSTDPNNPTEFRFGDINMSGALDTVTISGHVKIYVDNNIKIAGNGVMTLATGATLQIVQGPTGSAGGANEIDIVGNSIVNVSGTPPKPASFVLNSATPGDAKLSGTSDFYGVIYAPSARVDLQGNNQTYGAVVANELVVSGNPAFHYDESLAYDADGIQDFDKLSWREVAPALEAYYP